LSGGGGADRLGDIVEERLKVLGVRDCGVGGAGALVEVVKAGVGAISRIVGGGGAGDLEVVFRVIEASDALRWGGAGARLLRLLDL